MGSKQQVPMSDMNIHYIKYYDQQDAMSHHTGYGKANEQADRQKTIPDPTAISEFGVNMNTIGVQPRASFQGSVVSSLEDKGGIMKDVQASLHVHSMVPDTASVQSVNTYNGMRPRD